MLPILGQLGPITFYSFGLMLTLAFLVGTFLLFRQTKDKYLNEEKVFDVVFSALVAGIVGARLFYIIEHFDNFGFSLLAWLSVTGWPGFSLWGGLGVGTAVFLLATKKAKLPLFEMFDVIIQPLLVAFILGNFGLFLSGGEIGTPTSLPWGVVFFSTLKRHPVTLYKIVATLFTLFLMTKLKTYFSQRRLPRGSLFFSALTIQSFWLFLITFFKEDVAIIGSFFKLDNLVYFMLIITSSLLFYKRLGRNWQKDLLLLKLLIKERFLTKKSQDEKISS